VYLHPFYVGRPFLFFFPYLAVLFSLNVTVCPTHFFLLRTLTTLRTLRSFVPTSARSLLGTGTSMNFEVWCRHPPPPTFLRTAEASSQWEPILDAYLPL